MKSTQEKTIFWLALLVVSILLLMSMHVFRFPSDYSTESDVSASLSQTGSYAIKRLFPRATTVCFINSYNTPEKLENQVTAIDFMLLRLKINDFIGSGDHVWWIVGINSGGLVGMVRMSGKIRSTTKNVTCVKTENSHMKFSHSDTYTTYFEIN